MSDLFDNSSAARVASLFTRGEAFDDDEVPGVFSMTFRLPVTMAATISVMADHAGQSRNEMAQLILKVGLSAVYKETPTTIQAELQEAIADRISEFL